MVPTEELVGGCQVKGMDCVDPVLKTLDTFILRDYILTRQNEFMLFFFCKKHIISRFEHREILIQHNKEGTMKKILVVSLVTLALFLSGSVIAMDLEKNIVKISANGPAPNSGDGIPDGSGFDSPFGPVKGK
ncbi:MAG: hypothetical protein V1793_12310 [Pseudomonadota bacterium]